MFRKLQALELGAPRHFHWVKGVLGSIVVMNTLDAGFTLYWIQKNLAVEANPLMVVLLNHGPVFFVLGKSILVILGCVLLWRLREHRLSILATFFAFLSYYYLLIYHLYALDLKVMQGMY